MTEIDFEIPINGRVYVGKPPHLRDEIKAVIVQLKVEIAGLLKGLIA